MIADRAIKSDVELKTVVEAAPDSALLVYVVLSESHKYHLRVKHGKLEYSYAGEIWAEFPMGTSTWYANNCGFKVFVNYWDAFGYCRVI